MIFLGVDPDSQCSGFAICSPTEVLAVGVADTRELALTGERAAVEQAALLSHKITTLRISKIKGAVVERPEIYARGSANANNLIPIAGVAGAAVAAARLHTNDVRWALPKQWKGQQPKGVNQRATLTHYGWGFEVVSKEAPARVTKVPKGVARVTEIPDSAWKEVVDAIGMALWGLRRAA